MIATADATWIETAPEIGIAMLTGIEVIIGATAIGTDAGIAMSVATRIGTGMITGPGAMNRTGIAGGITEHRC